MVSNCADLTLSIIFLYLTVRSPIWPYNYRKCYDAEYSVKSDTKAGPYASQN